MDEITGVDQWNLSLSQIGTDKVTDGTGDDLNKTKFSEIDRMIDDTWFF